MLTLELMFLPNYRFEIFQQCLNQKSITYREGFDVEFSHFDPPIKILTPNISQRAISSDLTL